MRPSPHSRIRHHGLESSGKRIPIQAGVVSPITVELTNFPQELERKATSTSGNEALGHAIEAAGLYMEAVQKASTPAERTRLGRKCGDMLDLAEKLKSLLLNREPPGPKSTRQLSTAEKTIILRSSKIHGKVFPPWEAAPEPSAFAKVGGEMYMYETP